MNPAYRSTQLAHIDECIALTERVATPQERADAEFFLSQPPITTPQSELPL
jgi:hypothetical protein